MRITPGAPNAIATAGAGTARRSGSGSFALRDAGSARSGSRAGAAAPLATMDAILALQGEEEDRGERRRRSARRGQDLLAGLDRLKASLLAGTVPTADLRRLADGLWTGAGSSGDPELDDIVGAIELRAKVELAKLGIA